MLVVFFFLVVMVAAVYGTMPQQSALSWVEKSPQDEKIKAEYEKLCNEKNNKNTWLISETPATPGGPKQEVDASRPLCPTQKDGSVKYTGIPLGEMRDANGEDKILALQWGMLHSVSLYWALALNKPEITGDVRATIAEHIKPCFIYKKSAIISCSKDG
ncbi:hypothetical protein NZJ93_12605 [Desulfofundulus thermocisternus]|nr:hypothetical protein [Desulfofundulus thermocisternus]